MSINIDNTDNKQINLGSGDTNPSVLNIDYSDNTLKLLHGSAFSGGTNGICIASSGNVGIGDATPDHKLDIEMIQLQLNNLHHSLVDRIVNQSNQ